MPFQIIRNDITKVKADVIVNTANPKPAIGGGTDSAIYRAAGEAELLAERKKIGNIAPGQAAATPAFALPAKHIIHTVGPAWIDGEHSERDILRSCYEKPLELAAELNAESIAFPLIATGVYGFPKDEALQIALSAIQKFLLTHDMTVIISVFDKDSFELSGKLFAGIDEYIDEHYAADTADAEYRYEGLNSRSRYDCERLHLCRQLTKEESLEEALQNPGESFTDMLFRLIDERGLTDPEVYHKALIDRKLFSSIRCKPGYKPKKQTALALAVALELDIPTTRNLLAKAGYAFSCYPHCRVSRRRLRHSDLHCRQYCGGVLRDPRRDSGRVQKTPARGYAGGDRQI